MLDERFNIDLDAVRAFLQNKDTARSRMLDERFAQATEDFQKITDMIVERFRPVRIYQWGSLLDRVRFSEISDIDIAVEGLCSPGEFFQVLGAASPLTDFSLDIVEMERIGDDNARYICEFGRMVYERTAWS